MYRVRKIGVLGPGGVDREGADDGITGDDKWL